MTKRLSSHLKHVGRVSRTRPLILESSLAFRWAVEVAMVLASFFWAIEAGAQDHDAQNQASRAPAQAKESWHRVIHPRGLKGTDEHLSTRFFLPAFRDSQLSSDGVTLQALAAPNLDLQAPSSITSGIYLPQSFREDPYYSVPSAILLRFGARR